MAIARIPTGVPGFDDLVKGGIPEGRATLVAGRSGTGKTMFALGAACEMAQAGKRVLFVTTEEQPEDLISLADALDLEATERVEEGSLTVTGWNPELGSEVKVAGGYDLRGFALRLAREAEAMHADVVVLDSITAVLAPLPPDAAKRHLLYQLIRELSETRRTLIVTAAAEPGRDLTLRGMEDYVVDLVVVMRNTVDGKRRRRSVEIHKYRRSGHLKGEYPCAITSRGLTVFPLDARDRPQTVDREAPTERFPSGVEGLDAMTGGGWLRDAIVLVRGPTGSGKTILCGMYALAGAMRGERVFYYGFEETESVLLRNFDTLGLPVRQYVESGDLKLVCRFPEATSPEDMIIELRRVLDEHSPSLIVLDSISAIEHVTSYESFRQFIVGITSALRQHGRSALLTQSVSHEEQVDLQAPYLSTLADAILLLGYDLSPESMNRYIRVLKMRGSPHSTVPHSLSLGQGGLTIDEQPPDPDPAD